MFTRTIFKWMPGTVPAALAFLMLGSPMLAKTVHAAPAESAQYGSIDLDKVMQNSTTRSAAIEDLSATQASMRGALRRLAQGTAHYLSAAEIKELGDLYMKPKPTEAETKRIGDLEAKGDQVRREVTNLQNTPAPSAEQSARLTTINESQTAGDNAIQGYQDTLVNQLNDKVQQSDLKVTSQVRTAVAKVAKAKKLSLVFKSDVTYYATVDITDEVIKELNK